jgi:hypothetical protein
LCKELHWQVFFRGELGAALRAAFGKSPLLMNEINLYRLPYVESPAELAAKVKEAVEAQIKSLDLSTPTKDRMNEIEEAVLETVSGKYLTPKASDTGPPIGILHRNRKGAAIVSPLTVRTTVRSAASRMMDGIRLGFARLFADDSRVPADAFYATKTTGSDLRSPRVRLDAPPIANADGEPHYDPHEDDVDSPTIAGIHRAETPVPSNKQREPKSPDKICMMMTRLACNRAVESSYWRMDNNSDVGLLMGYVLYWLPIELESMDLDTFSR